MSRIDVSIIVPVFNQWPHTEACLRSLAVSASTAVRSAEILLADDGSSDETATRWRHFEGGPWPLRYHRNPENLRFLRNCNEAARRAQARYLCFLNNDVEVPAGWLDTLLATLESNPKIGAVGPVFLDGFGRILECGAIVHSDGTARQLGQGASLTDRRYLYRNDVDYVSAACLLLRAELFWKFGGFDERYAPCYYEDTDLCLKVAAEGLRVVVDPRVRIVHHEGSSNGADTGSGLKRYQEINRDRFYKRWRTRLLSDHPSAEEELVDRMRIWRRRQVVVCHSPHVPTWDQVSHGRSTWACVLDLADRGWHVVVVSPDSPSGSTEALHAAGIETVQARWGGDHDCLQLIRAYRPLAVLFEGTESERAFGKSYQEFSPDTVRLVDASQASFLRTALVRSAAGPAVVESTFDPRSLAPDELSEVASTMRSDATLVGSDEDRRLLMDLLFFDKDRVQAIGAESDDRRESAAANALLNLIADAQALRKESSRWSLASRLLWHALGYPGEPEDFRRVQKLLTAQLDSQRAVVEQYRLTLQHHQASEARIARELHQSLGAGRKILQRT